jgi:hypothetical protein
MAKAKAPAAPEPIADGVELVAIEPIRLDGEDIAPGTIFSAFAGDAEALLAAGAVRLAVAE